MVEDENENRKHEDPKNSPSYSLKIYSIIRYSAVSYRRQYWVLAEAHVLSIGIVGTILDDELGFISVHVVGTKY